MGVQQKNPIEVGQGEIYSVPKSLTIISKRAKSKEHEGRSKIKIKTKRQTGTELEVKKKHTDLTAKNVKKGTYKIHIMTTWKNMLKKKRWGMCGMVVGSPLDCQHLQTVPR
ncbi:hypothetical protein QDY71_09685 [Kingella negevensis]|uniref:hypothetical protein n=1 Tax=Kingella negevensis TaxID=1522312 RepID=UPI00255126B4|nr:hypothetical protein [Kingella negevensis]MDK4698012.1 hypothetical protein [Kingella negevensis]